jgi:pimeloyl-ACP methyl ester carboxylesterase
VENIDTYVQDVINHVELMKSKYPPHLPYILMGHSMGGLIAAHATILRGDMFAGLVLSAAASGHECCDCCYSGRAHYQLSYQGSMADGRLKSTHNETQDKGKLESTLP